MFFSLVRRVSQHKHLSCISDCRLAVTENICKFTTYSYNDQIVEFMSRWFQGFEMMDVIHGWSLMTMQHCNPVVTPYCTHIHLISSQAAAWNIPFCCTMWLRLQYCDKELAWHDSNHTLPLCVSVGTGWKWGSTSAEFSRFQMPLWIPGLSKQWPSHCHREELR